MFLVEHAVFGKALLHGSAVGLERASQKLASDRGSSQERRGLACTSETGRAFDEHGLEYNYRI